MSFKTGNNCQIQEHALVGFMYKQGCQETRLGNNCIVRAFTIIYEDVVIGDNFKTGHHALIREHTNIGSNIVVGSNSIIDGHSSIGNKVKIESQVYIPTHTTIGDNVFIGPGATLTNDRYPQRCRNEYRPEGPTLENGVTIGANAIILPGKRIGEGAFVAAGTVVTKDIPPWTLAKGSSCTLSPLPEHLRELNEAIHW
ncbi:MAG: N-acetyltransferase [Legionellaceae bacterium]|nr:N-acetyltransferase [Legionellaceae bacterium]